MAGRIALNMVAGLSAMMLSALGDPTEHDDPLSAVD